MEKIGQWLKIDSNHEAIHIIDGREKKPYSENTQNSFEILLIYT